MAQTSSEAISPNSSYQLGDYTFSIRPTDRFLHARCENDTAGAEKSVQIEEDYEVVEWYVEANETEASVYALVRTYDIQPTMTITLTEDTWSFGYHWLWNPSAITGHPPDGAGTSNILVGYSTGAQYIYLSRLNDTIYVKTDVESRISSYYQQTTGRPDHSIGFYISGPDYWQGHIADEDFNAQFAYVPEYPGYSEEEVLIARFAIDLREAGGGPDGWDGGEWDEPGDLDEEDESEEHDKTLYLTVTGATAGSYTSSDIPADNAAIANYGCGGDGGHGGGGGAGASSVVIYKFATGQADDKDITATARPHGYGSPGGKGGKGGDGCIIIYY